MPSETKKTIGRFIRLTPDADKLLSDLRRLSAKREKDLSLGDVLAEALALLDRQEQKKA